MPVTPHKAAGCRIEPPVSVPVAAGAKAPAGFTEGGVQTQPAGVTSSSGSDRVFGGRGQAMSAQDLAAASSK